MSIVRLISVFVAFVAFFALQKAAFLLFYPPESDSGLSRVWLHGLSMDCSMAAYLSIVPLLAQLAALWLSGKWRRGVLAVQKFYLVAVAIILAIVTVADLALYRYWHFRLDTTPLFYLSTSPAAAMASASALEIALAVIAIALLSWGLAKWLLFAAGALRKPVLKRWPDTIALIVAIPLLFLAIRGGVTVSTMNPGHAYFSSDARLNHAAINPAFNLLYSATHQANFGSQYRFMSDDEASHAISLQEQKWLGQQAAAVQSSDSSIYPASLNILARAPKDIYIVILESFSAHLMPRLGGDSVAMRLDSIAVRSVLFSNFYASSFRTDRALPAVLSGMPGQPSTSVMKFVDKASRLPAIARSLAANGFETYYFYGGDLNFTNMNAYLVNSGFSHIVGDTDFARSDRSGKWGAPDHLVFQRAAADMARPSAEHRFAVVQTSSSHEPFEVPYLNSRFAAEPRLNAFAYADSCLGAWFSGLEKSPRWDETLLVIVPDHQGCWPRDIQSPASRHHVPLVIAGGAIAAPGTVVDTPGSQPDIAATLLGLLGIPADDFTLSHDLLDPGKPHYAIFSEPGLTGLISPDGKATTINADTGQETDSPGSAGGQVFLKAYLQKLYDYLDKL